MPGSRRKIFLAIAVLGMMGVSGYWAVRKAQIWSHREFSPYYHWVEGLQKTLPPDARILVVAPADNISNSGILKLNTALYPRVLYILPPGVETLEGAGAWIREKRLTWAVSLGGYDYDPARAYARRLDDGR